MKIEKERFIDIFLAAMYENGTTIFNLDDMTEAIKIMYSSKEFLLLSNTLDISDMVVEDIAKNKFVKDVKEDGFVKFEMEYEDVNRVIEENQHIFYLIKTAINKLIARKVIEQKSFGKITFKYDDPDGQYNLPYISSGLDEYETNIFTDGEIVDNGLQRETGIYNKSKNVTVKNSTYTIMADLQNKKVEAAEIRATSQANFFFVIMEAENIINRQILNYSEVNEGKPKVYKFKQH